MTNTNNKPVKTLRDGALKASIWKNESESGAFYSVTIARIYKRKDGSYADSNSFSGTDLLKITQLASRAYTLALNARDLGEDYFAGATS
ncbi:MAG: hypothetical protein R3C51_11275 [Parvularculaceae bacterium]